MWFESTRTCQPTFNRDDLTSYVPTRPLTRTQNSHLYAGYGTGSHFAPNEDIHRLSNSPPREGTPAVPTSHLVRIQDPAPERSSHGAHTRITQLARCRLREPMMQMRILLRQPNNPTPRALLFFSSLHSSYV